MEDRINLTVVIKDYVFKNMISNYKNEIFNRTERIYVKGYGFLSFSKNIGKSLSNEYGQTFFHSAKKLLQML